MPVLRRIFVITCLILVGLLVWAGIYARKQGFTNSWRVAIEREIENQGYYTDIGKLTLGAFRGLVAEDVRFFIDPNRTVEVAILNDIYLDVGLERILNKRISINTLDIRDGRLTIPISGDLDKMVNIGNLSGKIALTDNVLEVIRLQASVAGVDINLKGSLFRPSADKLKEVDDDATELERLGATRNRMDALRDFFGALNQFEFSSASPPQLNIEFNGQMRNIGDLAATAVFESSAFQEKSSGYTIQQLQAEAQFDGRLGQGKLSKFELIDESGTLTGNATWQPDTNEVSFAVKSSADIKSLLGMFVPNAKWGEVVFFSPPVFNAEGLIDLKQVSNRPPQSNRPWFPGHIMGTIAAQRFVVTTGTIFNAGRADFSVKGNDFYVRNLRVDHKTGAAFLNCKYQPGNERESLQFQSEVKMDPQIFAPFIREKETQKFMSKWLFKENSGVYIRAAGQASDLEMKDLQARGVIALQDFHLNNIPFLALEADVEIDAKERWYRDVKLTRNDGSIEADLAYTDTASRLWQIKGGRSTVDLVEGFGAFSPMLKEMLNPYQFSKPPTLKVDGIVDSRPREALEGGSRQTDLKVSFSSEDGQVSYEFLGQSVPIEQPRGILALKGDRVHLHSATGKVCGGNIELEFETPVFIPTDDSFDSSIVLSKIEIKSLGELFDYKTQATGTADGVFHLSGNRLVASAINGTGQVSASNSRDLLELPSFKGLDLQSENKASASASFSVAKGVMHSKDVNVFGGLKGDISVDLPNQKLEARLIPKDKENIEYRGSGKLANPKWETRAKGEDDNS